MTDKRTPTAPVVIHPAPSRFHTRTDWLNSWHSFSFGSHFDPANTRHGLLLVSNDDVVQPRTGFPMHSHHDMEIVTWVLEGELEHRDSEGNRGVITPGLAQKMSAGRGIRHSEMNPSHDRPVRLVQMWVPPDTAKVAPRYEQTDVTNALTGGTLVPVASGRRGAEAAVRLRQQAATLWAARLTPGVSTKIPEAPWAHLFMARGSGVLEESETLREGDAARLTRAGARSVTAGPAGAEILLWEMHAEA